MNLKRFINASMWLGTMTILSAVPIMAQAASPEKPSAESREAATLLRSIKDDAMQVQSAAARLEGLTKNSSTAKTSVSTWLEYDRQWNEIKPSQEDMQIKLWRLEGMQAAVSPAERKELDQSKPLIGEIQSKTRELRILLDKPGVQTSNPMFTTYASSLRNEARKLEHTASAG